MQALPPQPRPADPQTLLAQPRAAAQSEPCWPGPGQLCGATSWRPLLGLLHRLATATTKTPPAPQDEHQPCWLAGKSWALHSSSPEVQDSPQCGPCGWPAAPVPSWGPSARAWGGRLHGAHSGQDITHLASIHLVRPENSSSTHARGRHSSVHPWHGMQGCPALLQFPPERLHLRADLCPATGPCVVVAMFYGLLKCLGLRCARPCDNPKTRECAKGEEGSPSTRVSNAIRRPAMKSSSE